MNDRRNVTAIALQRLSVGDRSGLYRPESIEVASHRGITLAGCRFQALPVQDGDTPVGVLDQSGLLQRPATTVTVGRVEPSIIARNS